MVFLGKYFGHSRSTEDSRDRVILLLMEANRDGNLMVTIRLDLPQEIEEEARTLGLLTGERIAEENDTAPSVILNQRTTNSL